MSEFQQLKTSCGVIQKKFILLNFFKRHTLITFRYTRQSQTTSKVGKKRESEEMSEFQQLKTSCGVILTRPPPTGGGYPDVLNVPHRLQLCVYLQ
jgi:hypothetical protein